MPILLAVATAVTLAIAGCAGPISRGSGNSASPGSIPDSSLSALSQFASEQAALWGDAKPVQEHAVLTSSDGATKTVGAQIVGTQIVLVDLVGDFDGSAMEKIPPGAKATSGTNLVFALDATSLDVLGLTLSDSSPALSALGPVTDLLASAR